MVNLEEEFLVSHKSAQVPEGFSIVDHRPAVLRRVCPAKILRHIDQ